MFFDRSDPKNVQQKGRNRKKLLGSKVLGQKNARLGGGLRECPMRFGRESTLTKQTVVVGTIGDSVKPATVVSKAWALNICHYKLKRRIFLFFRINILKDCKKIQYRQRFNA